jgi:phospholipid/cholesterol/gamma-HCH transport system ATP-binding protein
MDLRAGIEPGRIIELKDIRASSGKYEIINGVSLSLDAGRFMVIMGPSGSGKSTILKVAAGLIIPDEGEVLFRGRSLDDMTDAENLDFRKRSGFVFQDAALWSNQSIYDNLLLPLKVHKKWLSTNEADAVIREITEKLGYTEPLGARPADLSTGEQKLIGLARVLVHEPELIFMDEPTASIDEIARGRIFSILRELKERRVSVIIVTHSSYLASHFADDLAVIDMGKIAAIGSYESIVNSPDPRIRSLVSRLKSNAIRDMEEEHNVSPA